MTILGRVCIPHASFGCNVIYTVRIGVGPTRLPGMGRGARRACQALPGPCLDLLGSCPAQRSGPGVLGRRAHFRRL